METLDYNASVLSCAPPIIARGFMFSGDLNRDGIVVTKLAEGSMADWPGPFYDACTNVYALPDEPGVRLVQMKEIKCGNK